MSTSYGQWILIIDGSSHWGMDPHFMALEFSRMVNQKIDEVVWIRPGHHFSPQTFLILRLWWGSFWRLPCLGDFIRSPSILSGKWLFNSAIFRLFWIKQWYQTALSTGGLPICALLTVGSLKSSYTIPWFQKLRNLCAPVKQSLNLSMFFGCVCSPFLYFIHGLTSCI